MSSTDLQQVQTPALVIDRDLFDANVSRLRAHLEPLGVTLRPHLKTLKSVPAALRIQPGLKGPITVSTMREAEEFAAAGARDIIYGVGISAGKLDRVAALRDQGVDLLVILDSLAQADFVTERISRTGKSLSVLIEIDTDGKRAGLAPDDERIARIGRQLIDGGAQLAGVLTHAGASYGSRTDFELEAWAERERAGAVRASEQLISAGLPCPIVSVGSTPTAHFGRDLTGVTEVRAGVFATHDTMMVDAGVCSVSDIALSVLATVTSVQPERGRLFIDAGWTALSPDRGTGRHGFGIVSLLDGTPVPDVIVSETSQEHGVLSLREGAEGSLPELEPGSRVRILPNHACATCAMHDQALVTAGGTEVVEAWPIFRGW